MLPAASSPPCRAADRRILLPDGSDAPADGATTGEIALRGNNVMLGYYKDPEATAAAAPDGWFRTGDVGVRHPDGYVELRDRSKDVIISGGENIASFEVEQAIAEHPAVREVAVIAVPDEHWGEVPAAYVTLHDGARASEEEIVQHVLGLLARFKAPKRVVFTELPKTSTGEGTETPPSSRGVGRSQAARLIGSCLDSRTRHAHGAITAFDTSPTRRLRRERRTRADDRDLDGRVHQRSGHLQRLTLSMPPALDRSDLRDSCQPPWATGDTPRPSQ